MLNTWATVDTHEAHEVPPLIEFNSSRFVVERTAAALEFRVVNRGRRPLHLLELAVSGPFVDVLAQLKGLTVAPGQDEVVYLQVRARSAGRVIVDLAVGCELVAEPGETPTRPTAWHGRLPVDVLRGDELPTELTLNFVQTFHGDVADSVVSVKNDTASGAAPAFPRSTNDLLQHRGPDHWTTVSLHPDSPRTASLRRRGPAARPPGRPPPRRPTAGQSGPARTPARRRVQRPRPRRRRRATAKSGAGPLAGRGLWYPPPGRPASTPTPPRCAASTARPTPI